MPSLYDINTYSDLQRLYPYLDELIEQYPYVEKALPEGTEGWLRGTRYETPSLAQSQVEITPKRVTAPTIAHEYVHKGIDVSPNWSYIIPPTQERMNQPRLWMKTLMGDWLNYPENIQTEEGIVRRFVPEGEAAEKINKYPENYFSEEQLALLPYLQRYLQYGPSWGSLAGGTRSQIIIDPTYRGQVVQNKDGSTSSERTMTFEDNGIYYVVPTLFRGQQLMPEQAFMFFKRGHLPAVAAAGSLKEANEMAGKRSKMLGEEVSEKRRTIQRGQVVPLEKEKEQRNIYSPRWRDLVR